MAKKKTEKRNWQVTLKATVKKRLYCNDCTEEEARQNPYEHASAYLEEVEIECEDYEVLNVEPND